MRETRLRGVQEQAWVMAHLMTAPMGWRTRLAATILPPMRPNEFDINRIETKIHNLSVARCG